VFVERPAYEGFVERMLEETDRLKIGDPLLEETQQGALVSRAHLEKVRSYVELAVEEGGTIRTGGEPPRELPERVRDGFFLKPTVITGLDASCRVNQEEIFGPVVTVMPFDGEDEVVAHANGTSYGLAATLWTENLTRAHRLAERIASGVVWINCWMVRDLRTPFGGMKSSGVGREGGEEALRFFTEPKNVCVRVEPAPSTPDRETSR
jgi:aminomuconate-semialdehyde/2-hydroxymuconate-6-semialdehyde dehydrogenase